MNGVAPGPIWTPLQISGGASVQKYEHFGSTTVFGRPGQPAELASISHVEDWPEAKRRLDELFLGVRDRYQMEQRFVRSDGKPSGYNGINGPSREALLAKERKEVANGK